MATTLTKTSSNVGDQVISRVENLTKVGFVCPPDYNFINAIKASMLVLQELKDKNGKPALEVATQASIASALFEMSVRGLDASKKTCYFVMRGNKLCLHESYFGKVLQVKRIYPNFDPHPVVIHEGDEFVYEIDPKTGCRRLVKHEQKLENLDKDFIGAYMYLPTAEGGQDLYIMSKKQILTAWSKSSSSSQTVHKTFPEKMIAKTIVNSGCNMIINSTPDLAFASNDADLENNNDDDVKNHNVEAAEYEEIPETGDIINTETGEVIQPKEEENKEDDTDF